MSARIESIVILTHARQGLSRGAFLRRIAREFWKPDGRRVTVHGGLDPPPSADAAILHIDLTRIPEDYAALASSYPMAFNLRPRDISKRRICTTLVGPDDGYDGPVIVKTNLNHRGLPERSLEIESGRDPDGMLPRAGYRIFRRKSLVPPGIWRDEALVVQRLHVQREGGLFLLHEWFFLGDRSIVSTFYGTKPVVKLANVVRRAPLHEAVPDALRRRRAELGFDYGKFDYVIEDGEAALLDANLTPNNGPEVGNEWCGRICGHLAPGIDSFTPEEISRAR